jgi:hypothetical protein
MNLERACFLLDISPKEIHTPILKKKYRSKCLRLHPDKRGDKTSFIELKDAYEFLCNQPKGGSFLDAFDETLLRQYLHTIYFSKLEVFKHPLFVRYFLDPVQDHLQSYKTYILHPTIEQLLRKDIYYLEEEKLYIPLWHQEIVFHGKIKIMIHPKLPDGIELDENNNILVSNITDTNVVVLGTISILMDEKEKKEKRIMKKGIPRIQSFIYDAQELSDIMLQSSLSFSF